MLRAKRLKNLNLIHRGKNFIRRVGQLKYWASATGQIDVQQNKNKRPYQISRVKKGETLIHLLIQAGIPDKYIYDDHLREEIKINAEKLAKEKHNYKDRLINMLDIINNKTKDFYGFIN